MKNHDCLRIHLTGMPHYLKELNDQMFEDFSWPYRIINRPMTWLWLSPSTDKTLEKQIRGMADGGGKRAE